MIASADRNLDYEWQFWLTVAILFPLMIAATVGLWIRELRQSAK